MRVETFVEGVAIVDGTYVPDDVRILELVDFMKEVKLVKTDYKQPLIHIDVLPKVSSILATREDIITMKIGEEKNFLSENPLIEIKVIRVSRNFVVAIQMRVNALCSQKKHTNIRFNPERGLAYN